MDNSAQNQGYSGRCVYNRLVLLFLSLALITLKCDRNRPVSLLHLQQKMVQATTTVERQHLLNELDSYYLTMPIPDSLRRQVRRHVVRLKQRTIFADFDTTTSGTIHYMENQLGDMLRRLMLAKTCGLADQYQQIRNVAVKIAQRIDSSRNYPYWLDRIQHFSRYDSSRAMNWLLADRAARLCTAHHRRDYKIGECFGALCLQLLQQTPDERIRLDMSQRLMTVLYLFHGYYDLAVEFAQREISRAHRVHYPLRKAGLMFHRATALLFSGKNREALSAFRSVVQHARKNGDIPGMSWYEQNGMHGLAKSYKNIAQYNDALQICQQLQDIASDSSLLVDLHQTSGIIYRNIGQYHAADAAYKNALLIARRIDDTYNQILALNNLGDLNYRLDEFDMAAIYYDQARQLLDTYNPSNYSMQIQLLSSLAELNVAQRDVTDFTRHIKSINQYLSLIEFPVIRAETFVRLGELNASIEQYQQALDYFDRAFETYKQLGMERAIPEIEVKYINSLIQLGKFRQAASRLKGLEQHAQASHDHQTLIDAMGLSARMAFRRHQIDEAISRSNALIAQIGDMYQTMPGSRIITLFREKIHNYLSEAVQYELASGNIRNALQKLSVLKGCTLNDPGSTGNTSWANILPTNSDSLQQQLPQGQLVINYFLSTDSLYVFTLTRFKLRLYKRPVKQNRFKRLVNDYLAQIQTAQHIASTGEQTRFTQNFFATCQLGFQIYRQLFGWPELEQDIQNAELTCIIPHDVLHKVPFASLNTSPRINCSFLIQQTPIIIIPNMHALATGAPIDNFKPGQGSVLYSIDPSLTGTSTLIQAIRRHFPLAREVTFTKAAVAREELREQLKQPSDIYIFIGHCLPDTIIPDSSIFQVAARRLNGTDWKRIAFRYADFRSMDLSHAQLVLLIGCGSASGKVYAGTGLMGISQSIMSTGCRAVLANLWYISINHTMKQVTEFIDRLGNSQQIAHSLQSMQIEAIRQFRQSSYYQVPSPYWWGNYVLAANAPGILKY